MLSFLLRDIWIRLMLALWIAIVAFYLIPTVPFEVRRFFGDQLLSLTFLPLTVAACFAGISRVANRAERLFWRALGAAFAVWLLYAATAAALPDGRWTLARSVAADVSYVVFYLLILLGIELKPHAQSMERVQDRQRMLRSSAVTLLLFGWLAYLVVIPAATDRAGYQSEVPSFLLYLSLDAVIAARLLWVRRESWSVRWATLYGLIALAAICMLFGDLLEMLSLGGIEAFESGHPLDLWWTLSFVLFTIAARARHAPFETGQDVLNEDWDRPSPVGADQLMMAGAVALPLFHHVATALGLLSPGADRYRQLLVDVVLVVLAALAMVAFRLLERERHRVEERARALHAELDQARRMDAVARVAGAVAHDFNNLLQVIRGRVELASSSLPAGHPAIADLREVRSAAMRASAMASDLLTFGRRNPVSTEAVSLHTFIDQLRRQLKLMAGEHVTLTLRFGATSDLVSVDPVKFERVLLNLVANARNAMPSGGRIELETSNPSTSTGTPQRVTVAVRDSGQGMSPEVLEKAFEPYFTTRRDEGGSGMGLSSAHGIVQAMGGTIRAESEVGRGASIVIELPVCASGAATPAKPQGSLLLVETDPHMRQMLRGYFADLNRQVLTTGNAMEALQIAGSPGQHITVLVTDTSPSGLTYDALIAQLRELHPGMKVVLIAPDEFTATVDNGVILREPLSLVDLANQVNALFSEHQT